MFTFEQIVADIDGEMRIIRQQQQTIAPLFWEVVDYQFGWDLDNPAQAQRVAGKKARPLLMALVALAVSGSYEHVLPAGAALELIHNFTLIHDDVMDHSPERRHRPAVWTHWGEYQAINVGDGLFALANLALSYLAQRGTAPHKIVQAYEILSRACMWTAEGQILDMDFEDREAVLPDEYITMVAHKSGTLIEAAARIGALLSTDDEAVVDAYGTFARSVGIAFQVRDDYLGIWGDEAQTGKSATSDIREKKKSYPVLIAFQQANDADRATLRHIYAQETLNTADIETVVTILDRVDAASQTDRVAKSYYERAMTSLDATGIHNAAQDQVRNYANFLIRRNY